MELGLLVISRIPLKALPRSTLHVRLALDFR